MINAGLGEHDYATIVSASTWVFVAVAVLAALMCVASLRMPGGAVDSAAFQPATQGASD